MHQIELEEFKVKYNIIPLLANIHNALAEINVRGDDAIRMAEVLQSIRSFVAQVQNAQNTATTPEMVQGELDNSNE